MLGQLTRRQPEALEAQKSSFFASHNVRYVCDYLNGSTANAGNHWVEFEVWGCPTTAYIGNYYEWQGSLANSVKYYYAGSQRIAVRHGSGTGSTGLSWLLTDHLGSSNVTAEGSNGTKLTEYRYKAWGETRYSSGRFPTNDAFTGQYFDNDMGLYYYGARWYDSALGRWAQPDTIVPEASQGVQAWDRFAYVNNNPVRYTDPSGHCIFGIDTLICLAVAGAAIGAGIGYVSQVINNYQNGVEGSAAWTTNINQDPIVAGAFLGGAALPLGVTVAGIGVATVGEALGGSTLASSLATSRLQSMTNAANSELGANPALAQQVLTGPEYAAGQSSSGIAAMQYGNAVERIVGNAIEGSKIDSMFFKIVGGPSNPDFTGRGILNGMNFDITTPGQVASHLTRLYGMGLNIVTYTRPPNFTVFP